MNGLTGGGFSQQSFALRHRIFEVEQCLVDRVYEVHPEVSFRAMSPGDLAHPKTSWNGFMQRRSLLAAQGIEIPGSIPGLGNVGADDVLDAAAAAWTAHRIETDRAERLPSDAARGEDGRVVAIWV